MKKLLLSLSIIGLSLFYFQYSTAVESNFSELEWINFPALERPKAVALDPYRPNLVWFATSEGLAKFDKSDSSGKIYTTAHGLSNIWCISLAVDEDCIWVGTLSGGANRFDPETERFTPFLQEPYHRDYGRTVYCIAFDEDYLWLGTSYGAVKLHKKSLTLTQSLTMADGLGENYIFDIVVDSNLVWFATAYGGAFSEHPPWTGGLSCYDKTTGKIVNYKISEQQGLDINHLFAMIDDDPYLWLLNDRWLYRFHKIKRCFSPEIQSETIYNISSMAMDEKYLWCVKGRNVYQIYKKNSSIERVYAVLGVDYSGYVSSLAIDGNFVWVTLYNSRINIIDKLTHEVKILKSNFLPCRSCYALAADNQKVYAGSGSNLAMINRDNLDLSIVNIKREYCRPKIQSLAPDGDYLWIGTVDGLKKFDLNTLKIVNTYISGKRFHSVFSVVVDGDIVWIGTRDRLVRLEKSTDNMSYFLFDELTGSSESPAILALVVDRDFLWVGTSAGLLKFNKSSLQVDAVAAFNASDENIRAMANDGDLLWIRTANSLRKLNKKSLNFISFKLPYADPRYSDVISGLAIQDSLLWGATYDGAWIFDKVSKNFIDHYTEADGLLHNYVKDVLVTEDIAWLATHGGVSGLRLESLKDRIIPDREYPAEMSYTLFQNYPNPFNAGTVIRFDLPQSGFTKLEIYNLMGQRVQSLINARLPAGQHQTVWNGQDEDGREMPSGIYYYRVETENFTRTRKLVLVR